jgi:hypothetical protein
LDYRADTTQAITTDAIRASCAARIKQRPLVDSELHAALTDCHVMAERTLSTLSDQAPLVAESASRGPGTADPESNALDGEAGRSAAIRGSGDHARHCRAGCGDHRCSYARPSGSQVIINGERACGRACRSPHRGRTDHFALHFDLPGIIGDFDADDLHWMVGGWCTNEHSPTAAHGSRQGCPS